MSYIPLHISRRFLTIIMSISGGRRVQIVQKTPPRKKESMMRSPLKISNRRTFCSILCLLFFIFSYQVDDAQESLLAAEEPFPDSAIVFDLIESIKFADGTQVKSIAKSEIDGLRDLTCKFR